MVEKTEEEVENELKILKKQRKNMRKMQEKRAIFIKNMAFLRQKYEKETPEEQKGYTHFQEFLAKEGFYDNFRTINNAEQELH